MLPPLLTPTTPRSPFGAGDRLSPFRAPYEFYPTPPEAIRALLAAERFEGGIWEPACGDGAIAKELIAAGYDVVATDIADHGYGRSGIDFLEQRLPRAKHIITNPPYGHGLGDAFVKKALWFAERTGGRVAMLLNIASLCHPDRHESFVRRPPSTIYALDRCVCFPNGEPAQATRQTYQHRYAWLIWEADPSSTAELRWLTTAPYRGAAYQHDNNKHQRRSS